MRRISIDRTMPLRAPALAMLCAMAVGGCVSTETHTKALTELEAAKKTAAQQAADLDALKKKSQAQTDHCNSNWLGYNKTWTRKPLSEKPPNSRLPSWQKNVQRSKRGRESYRPNWMDSREKRASSATNWEMCADKSTRSKRS